MSTYLHYWKEEKGRWSTEQEEIDTNFSGLVFESDEFFKQYPHGYKYWLSRSLHDAPDWVMEKRNGVR